MKKLHEKFVFDGHGAKKAVLIPIENYPRLLEDIHDLAVITEWRDENTISLNEMKKRLQG